MHIISLFILTLCSVLSYTSCALPAFLSKIRITRQYPQDTTDKFGWINYSIYIGIVLLCPFVLVMLLYFTSIVVCVGRSMFQVFGGTVPKSEGYSPSSVRKYRIGYTIFFAVSCILMIIILGGHGLLGHSAVVLQKDTLKTGNTMMQRTSSLQEMINGLGDKIDGIFEESTSILNSLDTLSGALLSVESTLSTNVNVLDESDEKLLMVDSELQSLRTNLEVIAEYNGVFDAPDPNSLPTVEAPRDLITSAKSTVEQIRSEISRGTSAAAGAKTEISERIDDTKQQVASKSEALLSPIQSALSQITSRKAKYDKYSSISKKTVYPVDVAVLLLLILFLVTIVLVLFLGLGGMWTSTKWGVYTGLCGSFLAPIVLVMIATLHLLVLVGLFDACHQGEAAIRRSQPLVVKITGQFSDVSQYLNVSNVMDQLTSCEDGGTFLDLIPEASGSMFSSSQITHIIEGILSQEMEKLQPGNLVQDAGQKIETARAALSGVDVSFVSEQIQPLTSQLERIAKEAKNLTLLGYDSEQCQNELDDLNAHSSSIGGSYFSLENVTSLNHNSLPYIIQRNYFQNQKQVLLQFRQSREQAISASDRIIQSATLSNNTILTIFNSVSETNSIVRAAVEQSISLNEIVPLFEAAFQNVNGTVVQMINYATSQIQLLEAGVVYLTSCSYVGQYYRRSSELLCMNVPISSGMIAGASYLLSVWLLLGFIALLPALKRVDFEAEEPIHDMDDAPIDPAKPRPISGETMVYPRVYKPPPLVPVTSDHPLL